MKSAKRAIAVFSTVVVLVCAAAASAADPQPGPFAGDTSQPGGSVTFGISTAGTVVTRFEAIMTAQCKKNGAATTNIEVGLTPVSKIKIENGTFKHEGGFSLYNGGEVIGHGNGTVSGHFTSATAAAGTLHFGPWTYFSNAGLIKGYVCDTGEVTFRASFVPPAGSPPVVPSPPSTSCVVPKLKGKKLKVAKRAVRRENCLPGRVVRRHSAHVKRGRVIAQKPVPGTRMSAGSKVKLVVSSGPAR